MLDHNAEATSAAVSTKKCSDIVKYPDDHALAVRGIFKRLSNDWANRGFRSPVLPMSEISESGKNVGISDIPHEHVGISDKFDHTFAGLELGQTAACFNDAKIFRN